MQKIFSALMESIFPINLENKYQMIRLTCTVVLLIGMLNLYSQKESTLIMPSELGLHYINIDQKANYIIDFFGEETSFNDKTGFLDIDGKPLSITEYPAESFSNKDGQEQLDSFLQSIMDYELTYLEEEVYKQGLEVKKSFFTNAENKRFLLWNYQVPKTFRDKLIKDLDLVETTSPTHNAMLLFISNGVIVGINLAVLPGDDLETSLAYLKKLSLDVNVYGGPISEKGWDNQIQSLIAQEDNIYVDSIGGYQLIVPKWLNLTNFGTNRVWGGTFPDIQNIKNTLAIISFSKEAYESFEDFNEVQVEGNVFGEPMLTNKNGIWMGATKKDPPKACNGISYKVHVMFGNSIYHCQYVTYETPSAYILLNFTATENTFEINRPLLEEILGSMEIEKP